MRTFVTDAWLKYHLRSVLEAIFIKLGTLEGVSPNHLTLTLYGESPGPPGLGIFHMKTAADGRAVSVTLEMVEVLVLNFRRWINRDSLI